MKPRGGIISQKGASKYQQERGLALSRHHDTARGHFSRIWWGWDRGPRELDNREQLGEDKQAWLWLPARAERPERQEFRCSEDWPGQSVEASQASKSSGLCPTWDNLRLVNKEIQWVGMVKVPQRREKKLAETDLFIQRTRGFPQNGKHPDK